MEDESLAQLIKWWKCFLRNIFDIQQESNPNYQFASLTHIPTDMPVYDNFQVETPSVK